MIAYFDESYDRDRRVFSVVGLVSTESLWRSFESQWIAHMKWAGLYPLHPFHMNKFENRKPPFDTWLDSKRAEMQERLTDCLLRHVDIALGHTMIMQDYSNVVMPLVKALRYAHRFKLVDGTNASVAMFPKIAKIFSPPYSYLLKAWMEHACRQSAALALEDKISSIFDRNFEVEGNAREHYGILRKYKPELGARFRSAISFEDKKKFVPLQAADILAYLLMKHTLTIAVGNSSEPHHPILTALSSRIVNAYHDADTMAEELIDVAHLVDMVRPAIEQHQKQTQERSQLRATAQRGHAVSRGHGVD